MSLTNGQQALYGTAGAGVHQQNLSGLVDVSDPLELLNDLDWEPMVDGAMSVVDGNAICDDAIEQGFIAQTVDPQYTGVNLPLKATITVTSITQGYLQIGGQEDHITTPGAHIVYIAELQGQFLLSSFEFCDAVVDVISLKLLNDDQLGSELVTSGDLSSSTGWVLTSDPGFAIAGGKLTANNVAVECYAVNTACLIDALALYKIIITVSDSADDGLVNGLLIETAPDVYDGTLDDQGWGDGTFTLYAVADETGAAALYFPDFGVIAVDSLSVRKYT